MLGKRDIRKGKKQEKLVLIRGQELPWRGTKSMVLDPQRPGLEYQLYFLRAVCAK